MESITKLSIQSDKKNAISRNRREIREICIFSMLAALMFTSKVVMEIFPNIHLLGMLTMVYTVVFRKKALIPIYLYVLINGGYAGFAMWWIPYLYVWTALWGAAMLLPKNLPKKAAPVIYMAVSALHGFLFGILYSPAQAIMFGLSLKGTIAWIAAGIPFDLIHGVSNFICGILIMPLITVLKAVEKNGSYTRRSK